MPPKVIEIFDRATVRRNRNRAAARFADHDFLFRWTMDNLRDRLADIKRQFPLTLQIGARGGAISDSAILMDIAENFHPHIQAEEEFLPFKNGCFDAVVSPLSLHTVNDLPGALVQIRRALKSDGLFMAAMLGGETLYELRQSMMAAEMNLKGGASPRVAPFADKPQTGALLQRAGFALPVVDSEIVAVTYDHPFKLMRDLRLMGEGNSLAERSRTPAGKTLLLEAARLYHEKFAESDGRIRASFEVIFMIGWAPHESQQKPLRPGSAKTRLSDALGTTETKI